MDKASEIQDLKESDLMPPAYIKNHIITALNAWKVALTYPNGATQHRIQEPVLYTAALQEAKKAVYEEYPALNPANVKDDENGGHLAKLEARNKADAYLNALVTQVAEEMRLENFPKRPFSQGMIKGS